MRGRGRPLAGHEEGPARRGRVENCCAGPAPGLFLVRRRSWGAREKEREVAGGERSCGHKTALSGEKNILLMDPGDKNNTVHGKRRDEAKKGGVDYGEEYRSLQSPPTYFHK